LYYVLYLKWLAEPHRPLSLSHSSFPHVGIIINCHTTQIFYSKTRFYKVKIYYDSKNCIYRVKIEVAVLSAPFHFYVMVSKHVLTSIHDFTLHKNNAL
jgi:hypothetical protein